MEVTINTLERTLALQRVPMANISMDLYLSFASPAIRGVGDASLQPIIVLNARIITIFWHQMIAVSDIVPLDSLETPPHNVKRALRDALNVMEVA